MHAHAPQRHKKPRTCTLIKSAREGPGSDRGNCPGKDRMLAPLADPFLFSPAASWLFSLWSLPPSLPHPSVINEQPSACLDVFEQTVLLSSYVKTTSPAGSLNKQGGTTKGGFCFLAVPLFKLPSLKPTSDLTHLLPLKANLVPCCAFGRKRTFTHVFVEEFFSQP